MPAFVDSHAHLLATQEAFERLLATMDRLDVERCIVVGGGLLPPRQLSRQILRQPTQAETQGLTCDNRSVLSLCEHSGGRLVPFYFANPWLDPKEYRELGPRFAGLKLGPAVHGVPLDSPRTSAYLDVAREHGHPVYLHCLDRDGFRVTDLVRLAERYTGLRLILGHGGIGELDYDGVDAIAGYPNLYFETSGAFKHVIQYAADVLGASRILYGSEYPLQSAAAELCKVRELTLSDAEMEAITGGNIRRLLARASS
ncbi:amidohydrolase [Archangium violaceum]|nr:amidohydrolase [Archangium violaceum]